MILVITTIIFLCTFFWCLSLHFCVAGDSITKGTSIRDEIHETLVSTGEIFELGFFSPNGRGRYVGIWYKEDPQTVVWVANRNNPLPDSTGVVSVAEDGNFKVLDKEKGNSYFSTHLDFQSSSSILKLLDTGNLVLVDDETESNVVWQSFQNPTDTFLPGMKMDDSINLTSWKSQDDPAIGDFTFQEGTEGQSQYIIFKGKSTPYWKSGKLSASSFNPSRMFGAATIMLSNYSRQVAKSVWNSAKSNQYWNYSNTDLMYNYSNSRLLMASSGEIQYWNWLENGKQWVLYWSEPKDNCSIYNTCGIYGMCSSRNGCECLPGFVPNNVDNWNAGDHTTGCKRTYDMCSNLNYTFSNLTMMEVGESNSQFFPSLGSEESCKNICLDECDCQAYSYKPNDTDSVIAGRSVSKDGCWIWQSDSELADIREGSADSGHNLALKIAGSVTGLGNPQRSEGSPRKPRKHSSKPLVIFAITILVILLLCSMSYIGYWRMMNARRESRESNRGNMELQLPDSGTRIKNILDPDQLREDATKSFDVPFFDLECILAATNDFSHENKLGQGGFGPVYKGKLPGGQEIAVKRLSSGSGQGLEEFKNEVLLIAKLQHRNLVRLLGYCVKADEKMLLYEYMPNKSLDNFIFDRTLCLLLDWPKRFEIILGIARGLLYLHQDSRLRIIHRDLKTSNILLDEEMNPKISDFGLARIVGDRETEASTNKVIGTYGYMSPEYALDGFFSIKSDVFSFGVVILEIISGKRNTGFYESRQALNLLGYAWSLWNEEKALDLMDQKLVQSCNPREVLKCVNVGLLCVQEDPVDRPTMSNVVFMLGSDVASLQQPKQPAFVTRRRISSSPSSSSGKHDSQTNNELTISMQEGR